MLLFVFALILQALFTGIPKKHDARSTPWLQVLSSILLSPEKFVQRCAVKSSIGEQAVLTFELVQQECLQSAYKGVQVVTRWVLHSVTGESDICEQPRGPDPSLSPDAVALAQLHALR